jgi:hypothetical protein
VTVPPDGILGPEAAQAYRDQLRARGRAAGGKDIDVPVHPGDGVPCGHGGCTSPATRAIILQPRPGLDPETSLASCELHEDEMRLMHSGLEPPLPSPDLPPDPDQQV